MYYMSDGGMGDYYMGDYYAQGDPGLFSSIIRRLGGAALGAVPGGSLVRTGGAVLARRVMGRAGALAKGAAGTVGGIVKAHPVITAAAGAGVLAAAGGVEAGRMLPSVAGLPLKGFHMSKPHRRYGVYPKPPHLVRNRRMRATNPRALRRALRRIHVFAKMARKVYVITHPGPKARARFRSPRRKSK